MATNINYQGIDENFPMAGVDNSSEGFRQNFSVIKDSLREAKIEIEDLINNAVRLEGPNDFAGSDIINANLVSPTNKVYISNDILSDFDVSFERGFYQVYTIRENLTITFKDFPTGDRYGVIRLILRGTADKVVSFAGENGASILYDQSFPTTLTVSSTVTPDIIEVWYSQAGGFFLKYLGKFNTTRIGSSGTGGGANVSIATQTTPGIVKIGSGLTIQPDGTLSGFSGNYNDLQNKVTDVNQLTDTTGRLFSGDYNDLENAPDVAEILTPSGIVTTLNTILSDIPGDLATSSIVTTASPSSTTSAVNTLTLTMPGLHTYFKVGQKLRIFGASTDGISLLDIGTLIAVKNGFTGTSAGVDTVEYKISLFDLSTGKFSPASGAAQVKNVNTSNFNLFNNVSLTIQRVNTNQGVLVYRKTNVSTFSLIAVLGSKNLGTSKTVTYVDYYSFDRTLWSGLSDLNTYTTSSGIVHFPITAPATSTHGWASAEISAVNTNGQLTLTQPFYFESTVTIAQDDTAEIQSVINQKLANGVKELKLGSKTYMVSELVVPDNFVITGTSSATVLKLLPWTSNFNNSNKMFSSLNIDGATNVSFRNITLDGNMQNQYLIEETDDEFVNYCVDLPGTNLNFENIELKNLIGGGIAAPASDRIVLRNSIIQDSGLNDREPYSPLIVRSSFNVIVSNNSLKNFSDSVDASVINTGMIIGNVVENCGSGISIFGSVKLVSNPNLILGPTGEFIPGPDVYNSDYDAVNIVLEPNTTFLSDVYVYQENGSLFDLTSNRAVLSYRVDKLRKVNNVEELYGEIKINNASPLVDYLGTDKTQGQFKFAITQANVSTLKSTYSYSTLHAADQNHQGLVYRAILTEYVPIADVDIAYEPTVTTSGSTSNYQVTLRSVNDLNIGASVRFLNHGGTPSLDAAVGTVSSINTITKTCVISYNFIITSVGAAGQLTRENSFVLAKGKIL